MKMMNEKEMMEVNGGMKKVIGYVFREVRDYVVGVMIEKGATVAYNSFSNDVQEPDRCNAGVIIPKGI